MKRPIVGFHQDEQADWVAELACGHRRHTRHNPPLSERPWVQSAEGRAAQLGAEIDCAACDRREIPAGYQPYRKTPVFDEHSVPEGLLRAHSTKRAVWARIHVERGALDYFVHAPLDRHERISPGSPGIVLPEVEHHVEARGPVSFFVEFWRDPSR